jgi:hypothetical protein
VNNSPGLSSVRMTRTMRSVKERRKRTTNKEISLNCPQRGKEQRHGGAYPAGRSYIAKGGRRLALLLRKPVGTPAYHPEFPLCIQFMIPGDRREST